MRHTLVRFVVGLLCMTTAGSLASQEDTECPRQVELVTVGRRDIGGTSHREMVDDPSFTKEVFLKHFGKLFSGKRIRLGHWSMPEYSLAVTFLKKRARYSDSSDYSLLGIVLSFNGGDACAVPSVKSAIPHFVDDYLTFYSQDLLQWTSRADGHDIRAHVPLIARQIREQPDIEAFMAGFEMRPDSARFGPYPHWCTWDREDPISIEVRGFGTRGKDSLAAGDARAFLTRFIVTVKRGFIENGDIVAGDPKAKVFSIAPTDIHSTPIELQYSPPPGKDKSDVISVYNSCEVRYLMHVPLPKTRRHTKLCEIEMDCRPFRWSGTISVQTLDRFDCSYREGQSEMDHIKHAVDESLAEITIRNAKLDLAEAVMAIPDVREGGAITGSARFMLDTRYESRSKLTKTLSTSSGTAQIPLPEEGIKISLNRDVEAMEAQIEALGKKAGAGDMAALEKMNALLSGELKDGARVIVNVMIGVNDPVMQVKFRDHRETKMDDGSIYRVDNDTTVAWSPGFLQLDFPATYHRDVQGRQSITGETSKVVEEPHGGTGDCPPRKMTRIGTIHLRFERMH